MPEAKQCSDGGSGCCGRETHLASIQNTFQTDRQTDQFHAPISTDDVGGGHCISPRGVDCCGQRADRAWEKEGTTGVSTDPVSRHDGFINVDAFLSSTDTSPTNSGQATRAATCELGCKPRRLLDDEMHRHQTGLGGSSSTSSDRANLDPDVEKAGSMKQVTLDVQGMTCSGCEKKLATILKSTRGITNVKTSFLNARVDFDLDSNLASINHVVNQIHVKTGFHATLIESLFQNIDVCIEKDKVPQVMSMLDTVPGLISVNLLNRKTVTLTYDPWLIGVRQLLRLVCGDLNSLAPPRPHSTLLDCRMLLRTTGWKTLVAAILTLPVIILAWAPIKIDARTSIIASLVLATLVQSVAVTEFYNNAFKAFWYERSMELDTLVVISITAAYVYSFVISVHSLVGRPLASKPFFETSTLLITFVLLGRLIGTYARSRAVEAVSMRSHQVSHTILVEADDRRIEIDARLLQFGDHFAVQPHCRFPTDGKVLRGRSEVDESMLTGESMPIPKSPGDDVIAGTVNGNGAMVISLTRLPGKNTVTEIAELVDQANTARPKVQDLADMIASWFIPVVVVLAIITFLIQIGVSIAIRKQSSGFAAGTAISFTIAVLAVTCPCALGLAVPMVLVITGGVAARSGVIIRASEATERSWQITDVIFDKTGTLTTPDLTVDGEFILGPDRDHARAVALAVTSSNKHPVSTSLARYLNPRTTFNVEAHDIKIVPGYGIEATVSGMKAMVGSPDWTSTTNLDIVREQATTGRTVLCITHGTEPIAIYTLATALRPEAKNVIEALERRNIDIHLISGDTALAVQSCAHMLGIPPANVRARCSPVGKRDYVVALSSDGDSSSCTPLNDHSGAHSQDRDHNCGQNSKPAHSFFNGSKTPQRRRRKVLFVGDGTNDAVALAASFVGVQIGTTSEVLASSASVSLLGSLHGVIYLLDLSRAAYRRIVFNFVWAAVYNVFAILLAAGAFVNFRIEPQWAGLGELVSVLPVVAAALTMLRWRRDL